MAAQIPRPRTATLPTSQIASSVLLGPAVGSGAVGSFDESGLLGLTISTEGSRIRLRVANLHFQSLSRLEGAQLRRSVAQPVLADGRGIQSRLYRKIARRRGFLDDHAQPVCRQVARPDIGVAAAGGSRHERVVELDMEEALRRLEFQRDEFACVLALVLQIEQIAVRSRPRTPPPTGRRRRRRCAALPRPAAARPPQSRP